MASAKVDCKVVLLGREYGGKTSLVERFLHNRFCGDLPYQNTIGAAYGAKRVEIGGRSIVLGIWDTAGSERYQAMTRIYYRDASAAILCFDLTDRSSFEKIKFWLQELQSQEPECKIYFVGTKLDLVELDSNRRQIDYLEAMQFAEKYQSPVIETSSRTGEHVYEIFERIARDYMHQHPLQKTHDKHRVRLEDPKSGIQSRPGSDDCRCLFFK